MINFVQLLQGCKINAFVTC